MRAEGEARALLDLPGPHSGGRSGERSGARSGLRSGLGPPPARPVRSEPRLALLGGFRLTVGAEIVELPAGAQRLVAVLALRGRTGRSRLAGMMWPESIEHRALASLRTGIWRVNQAVEGLVTTDTATVDLSREVDVDARRMARRATDHPGQADRHLPQWWNEASSLVLDEGELLPDWDDDWIAADRERFRQLRLHLLEQMAVDLAVAGRFCLAMEAAQAALRVDMLRESAHRTVIRVHLAEGNVGEARRAFKVCRQLLVDDVGVEPTAATALLLPPECRAESEPEPMHA